MTSGDKKWSEVHKQFVRVLQVLGSYVEVCDPNTMQPLPDLVHISQVR